MSKKVIESQLNGVYCKNVEIGLTEDNTIEFIKLLGGCPGWSSAVVKLLKDKTPEEVVEVLKGITCGKRTTSCPDQLAQVLENNSHAE